MSMHNIDTSNNFIRKAADALNKRDASVSLCNN